MEAVKHLSVPYEIIVSIDNGTPDTLNYFESIRRDYNIRILEVNFKDLSQSRNSATKEANGRYITFIDADDLMSANWLDTAYKLALSQPETIIHPEYSITFGDDNLIWQKRNSGDRSIDTLCMIDNNLWDSPCFANREIFKKYPYHPNGNGFGYEDKKFNSDTLYDNISHIVAPHTLLFVRRKNSGSMLRSAISDKVTLAPTPLLSYEDIRSIDLAQIDPLLTHNNAPRNSALSSTVRHSTKHMLAKVHSKAKRYDTYLRLIQPLREKRQSRVSEHLKERYPDWMMESWKKIHKIDNTVFPSKDLLKGLTWYSAENKAPGYAYTQLVQSLSSKPDTLFFVPHIIKGGADLVFINYANELQKSKKEWQIAMLQTEAKLSVWKEKISKKIDFIDIYELFKTLDYQTQQRLLATFVTQNGVKRIIVGNSQMAYDFISSHSILLRRLDVAIYCFAFGEEFDDEGRLWGHIHTGIPKIYPSIHRIITDNQNTVNKLSAEYAFDPDKFSVHYQPTSATIQPSVHNDKIPIRILWASRVCKQKRPDIIKAVSNRLDQKEFAIDAWGQLEEGLTEHYFDDSKISYKGPFNGMDSLPTSDYDLFIYTSEGDGVPNVLQEITAAGLPIIASNVGGIREFVQTGKTGYLVENHEDIDEYIKAIHEFKNKDLRIRLNRNAQKMLTEKFSKETWTQNVSKDFDK